jgi:hypothetical protein
MEMISSFHLLFFPSLTVIMIGLVSAGRFKQEMKKKHAQ